MNYWEYSITLDEPFREIALAFLEETPLEAFVESEKGWLAYLPAAADTVAVEASLDGLQERFGLQWTRTLIGAENWNALWEASFQPILVDAFCGLRASFHPPLDGVAFEIIVDPKMAFGTGHHETTFQMIAWMQHLELKGKKVLDYGCGTGILAMLARMLGAGEVHAIDYDPQATENTLENLALNGLSLELVRTGELDVVQDQRYEVILANINRNVILASLHTLGKMLPAAGSLLISGFYEEDLPLLLEEAHAAGFSEKGRTLKNRWACVWLIK